MSRRAARAGVRPARRSVGGWLSDGFTAVGRSLVFFGLELAGILPLLAVGLLLVLAYDVLRMLGGLQAQGPTLSRLGLLAIGLAFCGLACLRWLNGQTRQLAGKWCGVWIERPYRARQRAVTAPGSQLTQWTRWLLTDPATWRDILWLALNLVVGTLLLLAPAVMVLYGVVFAMLPAVGVPSWNLPDHLGSLTAHGTGVFPIGLGLTLTGLWASQRLLPVYGRVARSVLGPSRQAELTEQVHHLAQTRTDTLDTGAAELRRIERDLHDGAQARLVAMGMTLDAADQMLDRDPAAVRALLAEARAASVKALAELRDLVRGIHPPVLADRGLAEAIRALALDLPLRAHFGSELPGRPPAAVESAAYFAVSELLANVSKHSGAGQVWIDIRYSGGMLRIGVSDDGTGGADPARGTGLAGIERRLAAFDGVLAVSSPAGGPTVVNMEIPCALSSPKISFS